MVEASSCPVLLRARPPSELLRLVPRLGQREDGGVDQAADRHLGELVQEVVERHPKI